MTSITEPQYNADDGGTDACCVNVRALRPPVLSAQMLGSSRQLEEGCDALNTEMGQAADVATARTYSGVLRALEAEDFPISHRRNVQIPGQWRQQYGMCLGRTANWNGVACLSARTRGREKLTRMLCDFARREVPTHHFTSIQVNKDYMAALHVDKNNVGLSWIIGLGQYQGGRLWIADGSSTGLAVDVRERWFRFDGAAPHLTLPFRGRRYTIIYFTHSCPTSGSSCATRLELELRRLGFPVPQPVDVVPRSREHDTLALAAAEASFSRFATEVTKRGGVSRDWVRICTEDGRMSKVAFCPEAPLRHLARAIAKRLAVGTHNSQLRLRLAVGSLVLLPGDTIRGLGLDSRHTIEVQMVETTGPTCTPLAIGVDPPRCGDPTTDGVTIGVEIVEGGQSLGVLSPVALRAPGSGASSCVTGGDANVDTRGHARVLYGGATDWETEDTVAGTAEEVRIAEADGSCPAAVEPLQAAEVLATDNSLCVAEVCALARDMPTRATSKMELFAKPCFSAKLASCVLDKDAAQTCESLLFQHLVDQTVGDVAAGDDDVTATSVKNQSLAATVVGLRRAFQYLHGGARRGLHGSKAGCAPPSTKRPRLI